MAAHEALKALRAQLQQYAASIASSPAPRTAAEWDALALAAECAASVASALGSRCRAIADELDLDD